MRSRSRLIAAGAIGLSTARGAFSPPRCLLDPLSLTKHEALEKLCFDCPLERFNVDWDYRSQNPGSYYPEFKWDTDNCTMSPDEPLGNDFTGACRRHDFCYHTLKSQGRFYPKVKEAVDDQFREDMSKSCTGSLCPADFYHFFVTHFGRFETWPDDDRGRRMRMVDRSIVDLEDSTLPAAIAELHRECRHETVGNGWTRFAIVLARASYDTLAGGRLLNHARRKERECVAKGKVETGQPTPNKIRPMILIRVHVHVVGSKSGAEIYERITTETAAQQVSLLSHHFAKAGIRFQLSQFHMHIDADFSNVDMQHGKHRLGDLKSRHRQGSPRDLNIYFVESIDDYELDAALKTPCAPNGTMSVHSVSSPPFANMDDDGFPSDGCVLDMTVAPGSPDPRFNKGMVAAREVGHWFGLDHVFKLGGSVDSGCDPTADELDDSRNLYPKPVNDVPLSLCAAEGMPPERDSCPDQPGEDAIHNMMQFTDDAFPKSFSDDQIRYMRESWYYFEAELDRRHKAWLRDRNATQPV